MDKLIARRKADPTEPWLGAVILSWNDAGSPKLTEMLECQGAGDVQRNKAADANTADRWLLAYLASPSAESIIEGARSSLDDGIPVERKVLAFSALAYCKGGESPHCDEGNALRAELGTQLARLLPETMRYEMEPVLASLKDKTIAESVLTTIEGISCRPEYQYPLGKLYRWLVDTLRREGVEAPSRFALSGVALVASDRLQGVRDLVSKVPSTDRTSRMRMAKVLERIGRAQIDENTFLSWSFGTDLLERGFDLAGDRQGRERSIAARLYTTLLFDRSANAASAVELWPISAASQTAIDESIENEMLLFHRFAKLTPPSNLARALVGDVDACKGGNRRTRP